MQEYELSVILPSRNEIFLKQTIEDFLKNKRAKTEIIAVLDGQWADPAIPQHPDVNIIYVPESIGQRSATNLGARLAKGKFIMKIDAHCSWDEGYDRKMIDFMKEHGENITAVGVMRNLWAFDWKCYHCGWKTYQGRTPEKCPDCGKNDKIRRKMMWVGKHNPQSWTYCFDSEPHFQYHNAFKHTAEGKMGTIIGYKLLIDFSSLTPDSLAQSSSLSFSGTKPSAMTGIINLLADFASSHQFTVLPNSSGLWQNVASNTVGFAPIDNGWGIGVQEISFIRDKAEMERIATLPVLTDVVNYGYILSSSTGDRTNEPSISDTVCQGFLSERSATTVSPTINSTPPNPTTRRTLKSDTLDKFNSILGGEFVYSEIRKCFHNGSVALIPIHDKDSTETMSLQGSCWMLSRERYLEYMPVRDELGSWGNEGIEMACREWLSGGRVLVNHKTWYAHMFRTQGGDFGFPYHQGGKHVSRTKNRVWEMIKNGKIPNQKLPVSWLIEKFAPVKDWTEDKIKELKAHEQSLNVKG